MGVLEEPFPETETEGTSSNLTINHNHSYEASIQNRIRTLENEKTICLPDQDIAVKGKYWNEVKETLNQASSQMEYNALLDSENRDLELREKKKKCYLEFKRVLEKHPYLLEQASVSNPADAFLDFFSAVRKEFDNEFTSLSDADPHEMDMIEDVIEDLREMGPYSYYLRRILGEFKGHGDFE